MAPCGPEALAASKEDSCGEVFGYLRVALLATLNVVLTSPQTHVRTAKPSPKEAQIAPLQEILRKKREKALTLTQREALGFGVRRR